MKIRADEGEGYMSTSVSVDNDFARFGAKSYAINKINSVEVRERQPYGAGGAALLAIAAAFLLFGAVNNLTDTRDFGSFVGYLLAAALCAYLAYKQWVKSKVREYQLFLMTSSSETQAFVTRDEDEVLSLRGQIETAMVRHSQGGLAA